MALNIENNVEVPPFRTRRDFRKYNLCDMLPGQSAYVEYAKADEVDTEVAQERQAASLRQAYRIFMAEPRYAGWNFVVRKEHRGARIFRVA